MSAETMAVNSYRGWSEGDRTPTGAGNNIVWTDKHLRGFSESPISHLQAVGCANAQREEELRYTSLSFWYSCSNPLKEEN